MIIIAFACTLALASAFDVQTSTFDAPDGPIQITEVVERPGATHNKVLIYMHGAGHTGKLASELLTWDLWFGDHIDRVKFIFPTTPHAEEMNPSLVELLKDYSGIFPAFESLIPWKKHFWINQKLNMNVIQNPWISLDAQGNVTFNFLNKTNY